MFKLALYFFFMIKNVKGTLYFVACFWMARFRGLFLYLTDSQSKSLKKDFRQTFTHASARAGIPC